MEISQLSFVLLAAYSVCFGVILGALYDVIRIPRILIGAEEDKKTFFHRIELPLIKKRAYPDKRSKLLIIAHNLAVAVGDVVFLTMCGTVAVAVAYAYNSGRVRAVIFVGLIAGFLVYRFTVGRLTVAVTNTVAFVLRSAMVYLVEFVRFLGERLKKIRIKKERSKNDIRQDRKREKNAAS